MSELHELAAEAGLDPHYHDQLGGLVTSNDAAIVEMLRMVGPSLGFELPSADKAAVVAARRDLEAATWNRVVEPVVIGWDGALDVQIRMRADIDADWELDVTTEAGEHRTARGRLFALRADRHAEPGGVVHCVRHARIEVGETGYHRVVWRVAGQSGEALGISAPLRAYGAPGEGPRRWGVFAPMYGLADPAHSGAIGDLGTMRGLFAHVAARGGSYVATLPILAQFLDEPFAASPYSPASRLYWNELYLDLPALAALAGGVPSVPILPTAPIIPGSPIDYRTEYAWRRRALDALTPALLARHGAEIDAHARAQGVYDYAAFRALGESARTSWHGFSPAQREPGAFARTREAAIAIGEDAARIDVHVVAQWAMQRQLEALAAAGGSVGLYLDLPVGVSSDAYEVWRWRDQFLLGASAGAPPDPLFLGGQSWGLPPLCPRAIRNDHYRYVIACVRHHMRVAGMLRIDHVMGLFRLYCVVRGMSAKDGVYLRYRYEELLAILTLESQRHQCAIVGEDLGTVPEVVRPAMERHGLFRTHVGQWYLPKKIGEAPEPSPPNSVASLNTHDMATFAGWWRAADIDDQRDLGLIDDKAEHDQKVERAAQRAALVAFAGADGDPSRDALTDVERSMVAATADLARGPAEIVLVALDDLAMEPRPHNVPGTVDERPNWKRRIDGWSRALTVEAPPAAAATLEAVIAARGRR